MTEEVEERANNNAHLHSSPHLSYQNSLKTEIDIYLSECSTSPSLGYHAEGSGIVEENDIELYHTANPIPELRRPLYNPHLVSYRKTYPEHASNISMHHSSLEEFCAQEDISNLADSLSPSSWLDSRFHCHGTAENDSVEDSHLLPPDIFSCEVDSWRNCEKPKPILSQCMNRKRSYDDLLESSRCFPHMDWPSKRKCTPSTEIIDLNVDLSNQSDIVDFSQNEMSFTLPPISNRLEDHTSFGFASELDAWGGNVLGFAQRVSSNMNRYPTPTAYMLDTHFDFMDPEQLSSKEVEDIFINKTCDAAKKLDHGRSYSHYAFKDVQDSECSHAVLHKTPRRNNCWSSISSDTGFDCSIYQHRKLTSHHRPRGEFSLKCYDVFRMPLEDPRCSDLTNVTRRHVGCLTAGTVHTPNTRMLRSQSAPPFHRCRTKILSIAQCLALETGREHNHSLRDCLSFQDTLEPKSPNPELNREKGLVDVSVPLCVDDADMGDGDTMENHGIQGQDTTDYLYQESVQSDADKASYLGSKLQRTYQPNNMGEYDIVNENDILDISSGVLHLAGQSLKPEVIHKDFFKDVKVLTQVDRKFIPIIGYGVLAVLDQHAADERIRVEELRQKVLSGEGRTVAYLDAEQVLSIPEMAYQLLQRYIEQVTEWGWICSTHGSFFEKNLNAFNQQPNVVTLVAVPCILGVNLSSDDLLEFLQQLAETDGTSTVPPSVLGVLSSKACRGAIMFGDSLLPSECAVIVEELKQTSLCFQCAHGRPTTAPLVNLVALHDQIARLALPDVDSSDSWHGLTRHEISLQRTTERLDSARDF